MEAGIDIATDVCKVVINAANVTVEGKRLEQENKLSGRQQDKGLEK